MIAVSSDTPFARNEFTQTNAPHLLINTIHKENAMPRRAGWESHPRSACFFLLVCCLCFHTLLSHHKVMVRLFRSTTDDPRTVPTTGSSNNNKNRLCSHVTGIYGGNLSAVHDAIRQADDFHFHGGSLQAVQNYLNGQIPNTLKRLNIEYEPKDESHDGTVPVDEYLRHYFATHNIPRGGYGQALPLSFQQSNNNNNNNNHLPTTLHRDRVQHRWMDVLETWTHERFRVAVGPELPPCPHMATFSEGTYEAKSFCIPDPTINVGECHVFSIGSNDQWGFEEELTQKLPDCHVHTFDCTLKDNIPRQKPNHANVHFYPHCVRGSSSDTAAGKSYKPYSGLIEATGIRYPPKVLKMDIEGFEYDVLSNMLTSPSTLWPEQIMMEVHFASRMIDLEWLLRTRQTAEMAMFFDLLYNKGGYMPANIKYIQGCPTCMEILLVRVHFGGA